jgi:hypothetical protein
VSTSRPALIAGAAFAVTALAGVVMGVALDRAFFRPPRRGPEGPAMRPLQGGPPPAMRGDGSEVMILAAPPEVREHVAREIGLTPAQSATIDTIVRRQVGKVREISGRVRPLIDSTIMETRAQLSAVLTAEQREKIKSVRPPRPAGGMGGQMQGPPPGGPMPGMPPGGPMQGPPPGGPDGQREGGDRGPPGFPPAGPPDAQGGVRDLRGDRPPRPRNAPPAP